jgi:hypothetical protein
VVGKIGDNLRMDYTAQGHTVGLAARMEQLAETRSIYLTEHTAKLVGGYFALRDLGASRIKGVSEPLHVFELEGIGTLRTRLDVSRARGFSRFVGRQEEMGTLEAALARMLAGQGQVVGRVRVFTDFDTEPVMRANRAYHVSGFASVGKALSSIHRLRGDAWIDSAVRGRTVAAALLDEVAFWRSEESANPDAEVLAALRPSMLTIPNSPLLAISTPYSRRGVVWQAGSRGNIRLQTG